MRLPRSIEPVLGQSRATGPRLRCARVTGLLRVAVCTNRLPAEAAESLAALRSQVPAGALALVTSGLSARAVEAYRAAFDETLLVEQREGLSLARNRALAWCGENEALAFVDYDAVEAEG